jgi:hypothetical protein
MQAGGPPAIQARVADACFDSGAFARIERELTPSRREQIEIGLAQDDATA